MSGNTSFVSRNGQVTIPADLRRELGLQAGDKVRFRRQNGTLHLEVVDGALQDSPDAVPTPSRVSDGAITARLDRIFAGQPRPTRPLTIEELKEVAAEGWTERERRRLAELNQESPS